jgi:hypothetical protein
MPNRFVLILTHMKKCDTSQPILIHLESFVLVETRTRVCDASHHRKLGREFGTIVRSSRQCRTLRVVIIKAQI